MILRSLGDRRVSRTLRRNGPASVWDPLERLVAHASTILWENCDFDTTLGEDLASYCAFLARELEINEQLDLEVEKDKARYRAFAPRALDALDAISVPLIAGESNPQLRYLAQTFGALRAELFRAAGSGLYRAAA